MFVDVHRPVGARCCDHAITGQLLTWLRAIDDPAPMPARLAAEHARGLVRRHVRQGSSEQAAVD